MLLIQLQKCNCKKTTKNLDKKHCPSEYNSFNNQIILSKQLHINIYNIINLLIKNLIWEKDKLKQQIKTEKRLNNFIINNLNFE